MGAQLVIAVGEAVSRRRAKALTVAECPSLEQVITDLSWQRDDLSAAGLARLLHWDVSTAPIQQRRGWVHFLDTYELVQVTGRYAEKVINQVIHATPGILWVIAGRNPVDWAAAPKGAMPMAARSVARPSSRTRRICCRQT